MKDKIVAGLNDKTILERMADKNDVPSKKTRDSYGSDLNRSLVIASE